MMFCNAAIKAVDTMPPGAMGINGSSGSGQSPFDHQAHLAKYYMAIKIKHIGHAVQVKVRHIATKFTGAPSHPHHPKAYTI